MNLKMLPKCYKFFIVIIFLGMQFANSIEIQGDMYTDSISLANFTDFYDSSSHHVSRRYVRRNTDAHQSCKIPNNAPNSVYEVITEHDGMAKPGDYVKKHSIIEITCDPGYKLPPFAQNTSICTNGQWSNLPSGCLRTCPSLQSTKSITVRCKYIGNLRLKNCIYPVEGTIARMSCNTFYQADSSINRNSRRVCKNGEWTPNLPECYATCGLKSSKAVLNIVSGGAATRGDYPWQVGIYTKTQEFRCGGSLIDQNIVLSAAHCFTDYNGNKFPAEGYLIGAGKYYREYHDERDREFAQYSAVREIFVPEKYKSINGFNNFDIAVLILENPFTLTLGVQSVCIDLNEEFQDTNFLMNNNGIVTGWGFTQEGQVLSDVLKELIIPYISYDVCYNKVPTNFRKFITVDKICGGYLNQGTSVCEGDSGGGLVYNINGHYYVKGIVSTSPASTQSEVLHCDSQQYGLYTSVQYHIDFVTNLITNYGWKENIQCARDDCTTEEKLENEDHCRLPNFPQNGKYNLADQNGKYEPGKYVPTHSEVLLSCDTGFEVSPSGANRFFCLGKGYWIPTIPSCKRPSQSTHTNSGITTEDTPLKQNNNGPSQPTHTHSTSTEESFNTPFNQNNNDITSNLLPSKQVCGLQSTNDHGSTDVAGLSESPWSALLKYKRKGKPSKFACGGTLISNKYVVTAAHCIKGVPADTKLTCVRLGEHTINNSSDCTDASKCSCPPINIGIDKIIIHKGYTGKNGNYKNDIALIKLKAIVNFTDYIKPICIPTTPKLLSNKYEGSVMTVAGWGTTKDNIKMNIKRTLKATGKTTQQCNSAFQSLTSINIGDNQLCASSTNDFCNGNGGSALTIQDGRNWYITGIVSFGATQCQSHYPTVYTRASSFVKWIAANLEK